MERAEWIELPTSDGSKLRAWTAAATGRQRGLLLFQEAFGVNAHIRDLAQRLAREGYTVIAPELYHRTAPGFEGDYGDFNAVRKHMAAMTPAGLAADIGAAYGWLAKEQGLEGRIGAAGYCMGGRVAWQAAVEKPLRGAVSFYGSGIDKMLEGAAKVSGRMLFFWGGSDAHIPPEQRRAVADALLAAGKPFVMAEFSEAGHGFFCDARGSYHAPSARQAWRLMLAFLDECFQA